MLKLFKRDNCEANYKYYLKLAPQVRECWVSKEAMDIMGIKDVNDVFTMDNIDDICNHLTDEDVKKCALLFAENVFLTYDALDDASDKLLAYFEEHPESQEHFEAPTLFSKRNISYVVDYMKLTFENAEFKKEKVASYIEKMKTMDRNGLIKELNWFFFQIRSLEDSYCNYLSMGYTTAELEQSFSKKSKK